jgi:pimeloyl-ACP methyl ester carboxylesterase
MLIEYIELDVESRGEMQIRTMRNLIFLAAVFCVLASSPLWASDAGLLQSQLVKLPSGLTLNYVVQGDPAGRPVVLLHGAGDSWHSFELVLPHLPAKYRVFAVTLRGHGWSDHPAQGFASKDFAADIEAFLEQLKLTNVVLVGHSLGSFVAQQVAAESSGRVTKLVLIGSGPGSVRDPQTRAAIMAEFGQLRDPIPYTFARDFQASTIHGPVPPSFFETMVSEALKAPAATWRGIAEGFAQADDPALLAKIRVPTLLLWGDRDEIFSRADEDELNGKIAHSKLVVYQDTGHAVHWERPERVASDLVHFISE